MQTFPKAAVELRERPMSRLRRLQTKARQQGILPAHWQGRRWLSGFDGFAEVRWIDRYHATVREALLPEFASPQDERARRARQWLLDRTRPVLR
ncbi:hypothetical protein C8236_09195 [Paracidovorax avenae]|nr:hypothetical protein C8232_06715 [Paracidovorax avenae]AVS98985.1 hypothetical protein C8236_09195 [Paracidovorax avenae]AVT02679.1 hypothetical protein C8243_09365 [Paracidovorax avenae]AVT09511.1 hypothetical protein C8242_08415 [Paracidovorax avenae]